MIDCPDPAAVTAEPKPPAPEEVSPRLLRCFVAVAEELHFSRAADRLYVAQPALSRSIRSLEGVLGRPLFVRTTRSVALTPLAQDLLPAAREVLAALGALADELDSETALRVAHVPGADTLALILDELAAAHPRLRVDEDAMDGARQIDAVLAGRIDVAVCAAPSATEQRLRWQRLRLDPLLVGLIGHHGDPPGAVDPSRRTVAAAQPGDSDLTSLLAEFEQVCGCSFVRVDVAPGSGTEAYALRRSGARAFLTLASRELRLDRSYPVVGTVPVQAYLPWAAVWRAGARPPAVDALVQAADRAGRARRWLAHPDALPGMPWLPGAAEDSAGWPLAA